ncbi:coatomer WD associated region-domain-containing protein [Lipomyces oligophaga]|uniref:coatomer WD associated region-domain-containing protein n=1 Tax=Lipomyces oligophaga TaxID=45792 RepID=UPI0034CDAE94
MCVALVPFHCAFYMRPLVNWILHFRQLLARSDRVKGIDFHPTEPWILTTLYSGQVQIWSFETGSVVKTFDVTEVPVRAGKFIARKNWFVVGSDDFQIRVYNYNTSEKVAQFEAHPDYIRAIAVHPTQSFLLTASDDMSIKLWNWDKDWRCIQVFEGHNHYVMSLAINPKDTNTFASACLDRTIKIWSLGTPTPNFTMEAHDTKGVNFVDYYPLADKPYIITTSDDRTVKVWDYQTKSCVATLEGHTSNVSFAVFHPELPIIVSGSEDGTVKVWNSATFKHEQTLNYGLERAWCVSYRKGTNAIAVGFDEGSVVMKMGREEPAISMDAGGKVIWTKHAEVCSSIIKSNDTVKDGEVISLPQKELGSVEVYPSQLVHSPNGRFVAVCGDGEYIIFTALAWRNKSFGPGIQFVWAQDSNVYAVQESSSSIKVYKNFKEMTSNQIQFVAQSEGIFGGTLLGVKGSDWVAFYDWDTGFLVRRIDVEPNNVYWSDSGELVVLACEDTFYVLRFSKEAYVDAVQEDRVDEDEGVEEAFEVVTDVNETIRTGRWVGDCFIYTTATNRLNYLVGEQTYTISHSDEPLYMLGYIPRDGRVYLADKDSNVVSYAVALSVIEYQTVVLRGDLDQAAQLLEQVPVSERTRVARFLEGQGYKELALEVSTDSDHRFELALSLGNFEIAKQIATEDGSDHKWKTLGDSALSNWDIELAEKCFSTVNDLGSLLLIYTSLNNSEGLREVAKKASAVGINNLAFTALWTVGDLSGCAELLERTSRKPEAALFSRTYIENEEDSEQSSPIEQQADESVVEEEAESSNDVEEETTRADEEQESE